MVRAVTVVRADRARHAARTSGWGAGGTTGGTWRARVVQPAIVVREPRDWERVDNALARLDTYDWLVFSSVNGVHALLGRLAATGRDLRALAGVRLAGDRTGDGRGVGGVPSAGAISNRQRYQAEDLAEALAPEAAGKRFSAWRAPVAVVKCWPNVCKLPVDPSSRWWCMRAST